MFFGNTEIYLAQGTYQKLHWADKASFPAIFHTQGNIMHII